MTAMILPDGTRNELNYGIAGAAQGRLVEELHDVANLAVSTRRGYDTVGFEIETIDGNGAVIGRVYNALGALSGWCGRRSPALPQTNATIIMPTNMSFGSIAPKGAYAGALSDSAGTHFIDLFGRDVLGYANRATLSSNSSQSRSIEYCNDYRGLAQRVLLADGTVIHTSFDERRQPVEERVEGTDGLQLRSRNAYDRAGKLVRQVDVLGRTTQFEHDGFGRVRAVMLPNGTERRFAWGPRDLLMSEEGVGDDGTGVARRLAFTVHAYDEKGRRTSTTIQLFEDDPALASDHTTLFFHDANDRLERIVDHRGGITQRQYDGLGRLVAQTDPLGNVERFVHDAAGQVIEQHADHLEPGGGLTTITRRFAYDERGRLVETIEPDGARVTHVHDDRDLPVRATDRLGVVTETEFDAFNLGCGRSTMWAGWRSPSSGNMIRIHASPPTRPVGEVSTYAYDSVGRMVSLLYPGGFASTRTYNAQNQLERETTGERCGADYAYDAAGRVAGITGSARGPAAATDRRACFAYDGLDRVTRAQVGAHSIERRYDSRGRLLAETAQGATITCRYDDGAGTVEKSWPDRRTELLSHDLNGHLTAIAQTAAGALGESNGPLASFQPSGPGALGAASFRGGAELHNSFDERKRLTEIALTSTVGLNEQVRYRYNARRPALRRGDRRSRAGDQLFRIRSRRRLQLARDGFAVAIPAAATQAQHDAAIAAVEAASAGAAHEEAFGYDAADARDFAHRDRSASRGLCLWSGTPASE